jgi:hypothetical protein
MEARIAQEQRFDQEQQAQIVREQLEGFKKIELARRAELEWREQLTDLARAAALVQQVQSAGLSSQAELARQAELAQAQAGSARPPELTPEQQAQQAQYLLEQQAQHALEQMKQRQPPYPEYPGQEGGFQQ